MIAIFRVSWMGVLSLVQVYSTRENKERGHNNHNEKKLELLSSMSVSNYQPPRNVTIFKDLHGKPKLQHLP